MRGYQNKSGKYRGSSRKIAAARAALGRANQVLANRSSMSSRSYGPLANRGWYGEYSLRGRAELKYVDVRNVNVALTTAWSVVPINLLLQGSDNTQRIGRKVIMKSILFNGNVFNLATTSLNAFNGGYCRFAIIYDTQPNSVATPPLGTDIFQNDDPNSPMNLNYRDRFQVVLDVRKQVSAFAMDTTPKLIAGSPSNSFWKKYKKMNKETIYSGTGATIGSVATGALYLCVISDAAVTAFDYHTRVRFTDM